MNIVERMNYINRYIAQNAPFINVCADYVGTNVDSISRLDRHGYIPAVFAHRGEANILINPNFMLDYILDKYCKILNQLNDSTDALQLLTGYSCEELDIDQIKNTFIPHIIVTKKCFDISIVAIIDNIKFNKICKFKCDSISAIILTFYNYDIKISTSIHPIDVVTIYSGNNFSHYRDELRQLTKSDIDHIFSTYKKCQLISDSKIVFNHIVKDISVNLSIYGLGLKGKHDETNINDAYYIINYNIDNIDEFIEHACMILTSCADFTFSDLKQLFPLIIEHGLHTKKAINL